MKKDNDLVHAVTQGDRDAFLTLYDRYSTRVYGLAIRILQDPMASEEVTQDTFLRLWTRATTFNPAKGRFLTWLLTITRRLAIDRIRLESRQPKEVGSLDEQDWDWVPDPNSTTDESRWGTLGFALKDLPSLQRQVIELAFYQGLSQSQIAEHINIPLGTVKTRIRLGMEKLREAILQENSAGEYKSKNPVADVSDIERYR